jgi:hypothetical protein
MSLNDFDRNADLGHGLSWNQVSRLRPVVWDWIDEAKYGHQDNVGFIAQELQKILPDCVVTMPEGHLGINYARLSAILVATMQKIQQIAEKA